MFWIEWNDLKCVCLRYTLSINLNSLGRSDLKKLICTGI